MAPSGAAITGVRPEALIVVGTHTDVATLAPLAAAVTGAGRVRALVVATGMHPMLVHEALDEIGTPPDVTLLVDRLTQTVADEVATLLTRLDRLVDERRPSAVVVCGASPAALATAQAAFWREIPIVHVEPADSTTVSAFPGPAARDLISRLATVRTGSADPRAVERAVARICAPQVEQPTRATPAIA